MLITSSRSQCDSTRWSQLAQNRDFCLPHLHSTPPLGGPVGILPYTVWYGKTRIVWLPDGEKNFEEMFILFDRIHERDGRTDGRTPHDAMPRLHSTARQNRSQCAFLQLMRYRELRVRTTRNHTFRNQIYKLECF